MIRLESEQVDMILAQQIQEIRELKRQTSEALSDIKQIHHKYDSAHKKAQEQMHQRTLERIKNECFVRPQNDQRWSLMGKKNVSSMTPHESTLSMEQKQVQQSLSNTQNNEVKHHRMASRISSASLSETNSMQYHSQNTSERKIEANSSAKAHAGNHGNVSMFKTPIQTSRITSFAANNRTSGGERRHRQSLQQIDENDMSFLSHSPTKSSFSGEDI